jgi:uncharacterized protein
MIIDSHTHIGDFGGVGEGRATMQTKDLLRSMEEAGIDISIVIANNLKGQEEGTDNEELLQEVQKFPDKLRAVANLDFPRLNEEEYTEGLLALLENKLVVGLKLYSGYQNYDPCNDLLTPFYETCQKRNMSVIFHTGYLLEGTSGSKEYAHPKILGTLAEKFSELSIIAAHFGNPWVKECGEVMRQHQNIYTDLSGYFTEFQPISKEEKQEFQRDVQLLKEAAGGLDKCLFGTDWWLYSQKEYKEAVEALPLSSRERDLIFFENAQKLFRIEEHKR